MIRPVYISKMDWFNSLIVDYPNNNLPTMTYYNQDKWQELAATICNTGDFKNSAVPLPSSIRTNNEEVTWGKWASVVYYIMTN